MKIAINQIDSEQALTFSGNRFFTKEQLEEIAEA